MDVKHFLIWVTVDSVDYLHIMSGEYRNGELQGRAKVVYSDGDSLDGYFQAGVLHGFARFFDAKGRLKFAGQHRDGVAVGGGAK